MWAPAPARLALIKQIVMETTKRLKVRESIIALDASPSDVMRVCRFAVTPVPK
jgi:hypothetical protein